MENINQQIASKLLQINAIKFNPANPFQWTSGWKSPIYCDNRKTLSYPDLRRQIREAFVELIRQEYGMPDVIAGVATGAIAMGVLTAEAMDLPFVYVRSSQKKHGLQNTIEGEFKEGQRVVVVEDLVSTGNSSLRAVDALRQGGGEVLGMVAIFSYGFDRARQNFEQKQCRLHTLSDYQTLVDVAMKQGYLKEEYRPDLEQWRRNPSEWGQ
jgi:orotate phosphoribosyltransferase